MSSVSFTKAELLVLTQQENPHVFSKGTRVTLSDISLSISAKASTSMIIQELGKIFQMSNVCLSIINPQTIDVEQVNPLTFSVLEKMTLHSANRTNWLSPPFNRFAFRAITVIHDVDAILKKTSPIWDLTRKGHKIPPENFENVMYKSHDDTDRNFLYMLMKTHTNGIVVLRNGEIIYENYFEGQDEHTPHIQFSVTKSLLGMIVAQLIVDGVIDPEKHIEKYIPELAGSAFADAKVIEVLDMTSGMKYNEEYDNPNSDIKRHLIAAGYLNQPPDYSYAKTLRTFLPTVKKEGDHNQVFHYVSANTEVLSWLVEKATALKGRKVTVIEIFGDRIWSKIGAEHDAIILKDSAGDPSWAGGFTATTRDMARVGQMILNHGRAKTEQLLSPQAFKFMSNRDLRPQYALSIFDKFFPATKGWSYANQFWWTHNDHNAFAGIGIHGQLLYIDPKANMVIAKNSCHPAATDMWLGHDAVLAIHALIKQHLIKEPISLL